MDHADLVAELSFIEKLSAAERIQLAKQRRTLQLIRWHEREKGSTIGDHDSPCDTAKRRKVDFSANISLLDATARNDIQEVNHLLQQGIDPDCRNEDGLTALHQCAVDNNEEIMRILLSYGANVNVRDSELWTPLHAAACCGHISIMQLLIKSGAELLAVNSDGNMPYDVCDDEEALDYIETEMASRGITQEEIDEERLVYEKKMLEDMTWISKHGGSLDFKNDTGATPLHIASANGYYTVVEYLLECGCWVHVRDNDGWQPVHAASYWAQPDVVELLVQFGADISAKTTAGETPLDLCEDDVTRDVILTLQMEAQRRNLLSFARDSRRMSKRRKPTSKFESPSVSSSTENRFSSTRSAVRRMSIRDRTGVTLARLEAQREAALMRSWSFDEADRDKGDDADQEDSSFVAKQSDTTEYSSSLPYLKDDVCDSKDRSLTSQTLEESNSEISLGNQTPATSKILLTRNKLPAIKRISRPPPLRQQQIDKNETGESVGAESSSSYSKPSVVVVSERTGARPNDVAYPVTPPVKKPTIVRPVSSVATAAEPLTLSDLKKKRSEVRSTKSLCREDSSGGQKLNSPTVIASRPSTVTNNNALETKAKKQSSLKCCTIS